MRGLTGIIPQRMGAEAAFLVGWRCADPTLYYPPVQKEPASSFCQAVHMPYPALGHEPVS